MIYRNVELHNVDDILKQDDGSVLLLRVPASVCEHLSERGSKEMHEPTNSEIRFYSDSSSIRITLSALGEVHGVLFHGPFMTRQRLIIGEEPVTLELTRSAYVTSYLDMKVHCDSFSPAIWRFLFHGGGGQLKLHSVEGEGIRPPKSEEVPALRYLAYGTSLTAGRASTAPHLTYAFQTAWRLGADLLNIGSGGSCYCEPEMADYLASRQDWDVATLGLSLNMLRWDFADFEKRVHYLVSTIANAHPSKPVFCITNWPCFNDLRIFPNLAVGETETDIPASEAYREILRKVVRSIGAVNLHLLEGPELFPDFRGLSDDMIHASDLGMIQMAENLAKAIKRVHGSAQD
jgi:hypothetical protein